MRLQRNYSAACISFCTLLHATAALAESPTPSKNPPFEFHAYGRLGISTNANLVEGTTNQGDQKDSKFGLPTSRHVRDLNYLRIQFQGRAAQDSLFNIEAELGNLAHQTNKWGDSNISLRNAYFEIPVTSDATAWVGARRLEFEDVRLFDQFPLSDSTFYGVGTTTPIAGSAMTIALGAKDLDTPPLFVAADSQDPTKGNIEVKAQKRDASLFVRYDLALSEGLALRPTLIINRSGQYKRNNTPFESYDSVNQDKAIVRLETPKTFTSGKVGAVLSHWGNAGWGNHFVWAEQRAAAGKRSSSDKDIVWGLASSGDYEGWSSSDVGLTYGAMIQLTQYKYAQPKFALEDENFKKDGDSTSKSGTVVALGLQPVYYITPQVHVALDLNHTLTNKVGDENAKPNMTFVTPILRYATNKNALATPQIYTSVTYGIYESKARLTPSGTPTKTSFTTQTGCEFWF